MRYVVLVCLSFAAAAADDYRVPADTAYLSPDSGGARVAAGKGIQRWTDSGTGITWYGQLKNKGELRVSVAVRPKSDTPTRLKVTVGDQSRETTVSGDNSKAVTADFGSLGAVTLQIEQ